MQSDIFFNEGTSTGSNSRKESDDLDKQFRDILLKYQIDYIRKPKKGRFLPTLANYIQFRDENVGKTKNNKSPIIIYILLFFFIIVESQFAQFTLINQINTFNEEDVNTQLKYLSTLFQFTVGEFVGAILGIIFTFYINSAIMSIIVTSITLIITMIRFYLKLQFSVYMIIGMYAGSFPIIKGKLICDYCYFSLESAFMKVQAVQYVVLVIINTEFFDFKFMQVSRLKQNIDFVDYFFSYNTNYLFTILSISGMISMYLQLIKVQQNNSQRAITIKYRTKLVNAFFFRQRKTHHIVYIQMILYGIIKSICNSNWPFVYHLSKQYNTIEYNTSEVTSLFWYTQLVSLMIVDPLLKFTMNRPIYPIGFGIIFVVIYVKQIFFSLSISNMYAISLSLGAINIMVNAVTIATIGEFVEKNCDINRFYNQTQIVQKLITIINVLLSHILYKWLKNPGWIKFIFIGHGILVIILGLYVWAFDRRKLNCRLSYSY